MQMSTRRSAAARILIAIVFPAGATVLPSDASAQRIVRAGAIYLGAGVSRVSPSDLNDRLSSLGYTGSFRSPQPAITGGAYLVLRDRLMVGGEWGFMKLGHEQLDGRDWKLAGGYATVGAGYSMKVSPRFRVYPRLGVGVGGMGLWTGEEGGGDRGSIDFKDALSGPTVDPDNFTLSQASMVMDFGAGAELNPRRNSGPLIGLRAGYVAAPFDLGWRLNGRKLSDAPRTSVAGLYARVIVGWARMR